MLLRKATQASHRFLILFGVLCVLAGQASAGVHSCAEHASSGHSMPAMEMAAMDMAAMDMDSDHSGHDMAGMIADMMGSSSSDCCDQDCECPVANCSGGAALAFSTFDSGSIEPVHPVFAAFSEATIPSPKLLFRPPINA